ncbi:MAG: magnesium/cobalt transporter CorA [Chloroflexota bacterium]
MNVLDTLPGTTLSRPENDGLVACAVYVSGRRAAELSLEELLRPISRDKGFVWIGLYEPSQSLLHTVQSQFGLHDLAVEDAHTAHQRPKLEQYQDSLFVVIRTAQFAATGRRGKLEFGETHVFLGSDYLVTVRHGSVRSHADLRARCEATPDQLALGPGYVLYALLDFLVDQYLPLVSELEGRVTDLEEALFGAEGSRRSRDTVAEIYGLKRDLLSLKRAVAPLVDVCNRLMRFDLQLIPSETRPYFRDVYDSVIRINELIDNLRELLTTAFEVNLSFLSLAMNEEMKQLAISSAQENREQRRLAAWAAIIAVPTMIAGIYGMNFNTMPELAWEYGYPAILGAMASICTGLYVGFKRSGWL